MISLGFSLGLGLCTSILVAWGLALIPHQLGPANARSVQMLWPEDDGTQRSIYFNEHRWVGVLEQQYHTTRRTRARTNPQQINIWWAWSPLTPKHNIIEDSTKHFERFNLASPDTSVISVTRCGFPALALRCSTLIDDSAPQFDGTYPTQAHGAFLDRIDAAALMGKPSVWPHAQHLWFPYQPIWSGLAINTVSYAVLIFLLARLARSVRHARRMHRGRCPYCTYELGFDFSDGCPECGWRHSTPRGT